MKDASRRVHVEGLNGVSVATVMRDTGLTHGGFYKYFRNKDDLLVESLREGFQEIEDTLIRAAEEAPPGEAWKAIVKTYLSLELCDHPARGCPPSGACSGISSGEQEHEASDCDGADQV